MKKSQKQEISVLIVEDNPALVEVYSMAFQLSGFNTIVSTDGGEVLHLLKEHQPVAILFDLHLPGMRGDDMIAKLEGDSAFQNMVSILATGDSRRASFMQSQVDFVFLKPVSFTQLRELATQIYRAASEKTIIPNKDTGPIQPDNGWV